MINKILILFGFLLFINIVHSRVSSRDIRCEEDYGIKDRGVCFRWSDCHYEEIEIIETTRRPKCMGFWPTPLCRGQIYCARKRRLSNLIDEFRSQVACKATRQNVCPNIKNCALDDNFFTKLDVRVEPDIVDELTDVVRESKSRGLR